MHDQSTSNSIILASLYGDIAPNNNVSEHMTSRRCVVDGHARRLFEISVAYKRRAKRPIRCAAAARSRRGYSSSTSLEIRLMAGLMRWISASVGAHGWREMNHTTYGPAVVSPAL